MRRSRSGRSSASVPLIVGLYTLRRSVPALRHVVPSPWVMARVELGRLVETRAAQQRRRRRRLLARSLAAGLAVAMIAGAASRKRSGSDGSSDI